MTRYKRGNGYPGLFTRGGPLFSSRFHPHVHGVPYNGLKYGNGIGDRSFSGYPAPIPHPVNSWPLAGGGMHPPHLPSISAGHIGGFHYPSPANSSQQSPVELALQNPLQPEEKGGIAGVNGISPLGHPYFHPYPKQNQLMQQPSGFQSIMNSFKAQDGSLDIKKMIDTAGQMAYTVNQVQALVKSIGGIFKI